MEVWKTVEGYEGYYEVSNLGNVRSLTRVVPHSTWGKMVRYGKEKKKMVNKDGYLVVKLSKDGTDKNIYVHTLVAKAFVDGYESGMEVNHIDANKQNNCASNLEWVTHNDNVQDVIMRGNHISQRDTSGANNPNFGNHILKEKYMLDKDYATQKQSRPGDKNGRATPIRMIYPSGKSEEFPYIRKCAEFLIGSGMIASSNINAVAANMSRVAKNKQNSYYGFRFEFV